jgi:hypothetical protein
VADVSGALVAASQGSAASWLADGWSVLLHVMFFIIIGVIVLFIVAEPLWVVLVLLVTTAIQVGDELDELRWRAVQRWWAVGRWRDRHRRRADTRCGGP